MTNDPRDARAESPSLLLAWGSNVDAPDGPIGGLSWWLAGALLMWTIVSLLLTSA